MKILFIRHGDPDYEADSLTEKGWREAKALADRMEKLDIQKFYCSPLGRARDTAGVTLRRMKRNAEVCDFLQEFRYRIEDPRTGKPRGAWDLYPSDWTKQEELFHKDLWWQSPMMQTGAEIKPRYDEVCTGLDQLIKRHGYRRDGYLYRAEEANTDTIAVFCHLGVMCIMLSHLLHCAPTIFWQGSFVAPTSVTMLETEERDEGTAVFIIRCVGDTGHLYKAGEPVSDSGFYEEVYAR